MGNNHPGDGSTIIITMVECFICVQAWIGAAYTFCSQSTDSCVLWVAWNIGNNHPGDGLSIFITMIECFICIQVHSSRYIISLFSAIVRNLSLWNEMCKVQDVCSEFVLNGSYSASQSESHRFSYWMSYIETYDIFLLVTVSLSVAMIECIINLLSL